MRVDQPDAPRAPARPPLSLAVMGLGRIASLYDRPRGHGAPRSHIGAALGDGRWSIAGMIDPQPAAVAAARELWPEAAGARVGASFAEAGLTSADVVAVCAPPSDRLAQVEQALRLSPRLIIMEKPLATDAETARRISDLCDRAAVPVIVNFHRRFDPGHRRMLERNSAHPRHIVMRYGKGLWNYGSHLVDLLLQWGGPVSAVRALSLQEAGDPMVSFHCVHATGANTYVLAITGVAYDQFEAEFYFDESRVALENGGVERRVWRAVPDLYYKDYTHLCFDAGASETGRVEGLSQLYDNVASHLLSGATLLGTTLAEARQCIAIIEAALESWRAGQSLVSIPPVPQTLRNPGS